MEFKSDFFCCSKVVVNILSLRMLALNACASLRIRTPGYTGRVMHAKADAFLLSLSSLGQHLQSTLLTQELHDFTRHLSICIDSSPASKAVSRIQPEMY